MKNESRKQPVYRFLPIIRLLFFCPESVESRSFGEDANPQKSIFFKGGQIDEKTYDIFA